jgi:hypothetical protein
MLSPAKGGQRSSVAWRFLERTSSMTDPQNAPATLTRAFRPVPLSEKIIGTVLLLVVLVLPACGSSSTNTPTPTATSSAATATSTTSAPQQTATSEPEATTTSGFPSSATTS